MNDGAIFCTIVYTVGMLFWIAICGVELHEKKNSRFYQGNRTERELAILILCAPIWLPFVIFLIGEQLRRGIRSVFESLLRGDR